MRYLGIDYGDKRIGLAVSDDEGRFAVPFGVLEHETVEHVFVQLRGVVNKEDITAIVVGVPLALGRRNDTPGIVYIHDLANEQMKKVQDFITALRRAVSIPVEIIDERLSTVEAGRRMGGVPKNIRAQKDALAASIILQSYLDRMGLVTSNS